ncbi:uncharacterized protein LOC130448908 [Diorhabda sublineata]|uniref:uncharacterized protein LOC130448908 n=1 Tax=Diorhabda sublineata TaxID=1163346 RepID=UPI0024E1450E|nr:uncharacterized protein LOC130448908 [Diorhabda sublineata]
MKYSTIWITWLSIWAVHAQNTTNLLSKTKRNLSRDVQSYGESGLVLPYNDNPKVYYEPKQVNTYQVRPLALVDLSQPVKVIEPKVAAQQVLYEFQQTPTDAVSNVHVKQLFEQDMKPPPQNNPPNLITSETVQPAVHHGQYIQNTAPPSFNPKQHPLYGVQPTFVEPKKYVYGKIIVDSTLPQQQNFHHHASPNVFYSNHPFSPQATHGRPILNYVNHFPRNNIIVPTTEAPHIPLQNNKFKPPPRAQYQPIDKPTRVKPETKPKHIEKPVVENEEAEEDEHEERTNNREEEEEERDEYESSPFEKYFDDEDNSEYRNQENSEDDDEVEEDPKRGSSKYVSKREKFPKKYKMMKSYYKYSSGPDDRHYKNEGRKHKSNKNKNNKKSKSPPLELEAKYSEHVPVTHKKKILKEKWYISKSLADKERYDHES